MTENYKKIRFNNDILNDVYNKWYIANRPKRYHPINGWSYNSGRDINFEDWLWSEGAKVVQENHVRYLEFYDNDNAIMFF